MLDRAMSVYFDANTTPIYMAKMQGYINTLNIRRIEISGRYTPMVGTESQGVVLLRHILAFADIPDLLSYDNDFDRLVKGLLPIQTDLERIIDPVTTGIIRDSLFVSRQMGNRTIEILIPVKMEDYLKQLPLEKGWSEWQKLRPLRLVDVDSNELTFNTYKDQISFKKSPPKRAVFTVDVIALCLQYAKYVELNEGTSPIPIPEYLHRYVFSEGVMEDLQNLWLRNRYLHIISHPIEKAFDASEITDSIYHNIYGYLGLQYTAAMEEMYRMMMRCKEGVTPPTRIVASLPLADMYVPAYVQNLQKTTVVSEARQNLWVEYLRDFSWLKLAYRTHMLNPDFVSTKSFLRHLDRDLDLLLKTRFWNSIKNAEMRASIEMEVKEMIDLVGQEHLYTYLKDKE